MLFPCGRRFVPLNLGDDTFRRLHPLRERGKAATQPMNAQMWKAGSLYSTVMGCPGFFDVTGGRAAEENKFRGCPVIEVVADFFAVKNAMTGGRCLVAFLQFEQKIRDVWCEWNGPFSVHFVLYGETTPLEINIVPAQTGNRTLHTKESSKDNKTMSSQIRFLKPEEIARSFDISEHDVWRKLESGEWSAQTLCETFTSTGESIGFDRACINAEAVRVLIGKPGTEVDYRTKFGQHRIVAAGKENIEVFVSPEFTPELFPQNVVSATNDENASRDEDTFQNPAEHDRPPLQQSFQEEEILRILAELGIDPLNIEPFKAGKNGTKHKAREKLNFSQKVFDKAWERLSRDGRIRRIQAISPKLGQRGILPRGR